MVKPDLLDFLEEYEFAKDKKEVTDDEILVKVSELCGATNYEHVTNPSAVFSKMLKMDMSAKDVHNRISRYFILFNQLVEDNGLVDILWKPRSSSAGFAAQTKKRTMILIENLQPPMLREEIQGMAEFKFKNVKTDEQALYKLILERAELQQFFYHRFRAREPASSTSKASGRRRWSPRPARAGSQAQVPQQRKERRGRESISNGKRAVAAEIAESRAVAASTAKGGHWVRDCPVATEADKRAAIAVHKVREWQVKRAAVDSPLKAIESSTGVSKGLLGRLDDDEYTVLVNGVVEVSLCTDTGADCSIVPAKVIERVVQAQ